MAQPCKWLLVLSLVSCLLLLPAFSGHAPLFAQAPARPAPSTNSAAGGSPDYSPDYSKEPFVVERLLHKVTFENDGKSVDETTLRVRIQSTTGIQQFGVLRVPYASAAGDAQIVYARVIKPGGAVIPTPGENILDMPAAITQQAPFYSDLKEKHLAIKGMEIGDTLEYQTRVTERTPLVPGQFWFSDDFRANSVLLQQQLEVSVPRGRYINLKSPRHTPVITEANGRRLYTWNIAYTDPQPPSAASNSTAPAVAQATPDVQLSTFHTWDEVAQWYRHLQEARVAPTPEIRAKEKELTAGVTSDSEKLRILYSYVATKYRYIGIAFGIGRYQPHAAAEVLSNGYGDCKDKHTLLAALLAAAGIKAYPALLNSEARMDTDVPAPSQFDHVVTVVPQGRELLWLDSTTEVAPAGYLTANLRDIKALMIPDSGPAQIVQTPAGPPFDTIYDFRLNGKMNDQGTLQATIEASVRGDTEFLLRSALHRSPQQDWNDLIQGFSQRGSMPGTVTGATVTSPEATDKPLVMNYSYSRAGENGWSGKPFAPPLPRLNVPNLPALVAGAAGQNAATPITLQFPGEYLFRATIALPAGFTPKLPPSVDVKQDFAQYSASYSIENGVFRAERRLIIHQHEIPQARRQDYLALRKAVNDDMQTSATQVASAAPGGPGAPSAAAPSLAPRLIADARAALNSGNTTSALASLMAATSADPTSAEAWSQLGYVHALRGDADQGVAEMWKAVGLAPREWWSYRELADMLAYLHRYPEELQALQQALLIAPNDSAVTWRSAQALLQMERPAEAIAQLLPAVEKTPMDARLALMLGRAYIRQGDAEKAIGAFQKVLEFSSTSANLNSVARELADSNIRLDDAMRYAQQSVNMEEDTTTKNISLTTVRTNDMVEMIRLGQAWDTAGWAHFRLGDFDAAQKYFMSAWKLAQNTAAGDHLGQLYEKQGNKPDAARFYALALAVGHAPDDTSAHLTALLGGKAQANAAVVAAATELERMRTVTLPRLAKGAAKAQVYVQFAQPASAAASTPAAGTPAGLIPGASNQGLPAVAGMTASAVHFVNGADELRASTDALAAAHYDIEFPDARPTMLVRQGNLTCDEASPTCQLVFLSINMINSIN